MVVNKGSFTVKPKYNRNCLANNRLPPNFITYLNLGKTPVLVAFQMQ